MVDHEKVRSANQDQENTHVERFESKNANNIAGQNNDSSESSPANPLDRRHFLIGAAAGAAAMALPRWARADMTASSSSLGLRHSRMTLLPSGRRSPSAMTKPYNGCKRG